MVVPIDQASGNIALVCKRFYASIIYRELGLNNSSTDNYNNAGGLSANVTIDKMYEICKFNLVLATFLVKIMMHKTLLKLDSL